MFELAIHTDIGHAEVNDLPELGERVAGELFIEQFDLMFAIWDRFWRFHPVHGKIEWVVV